MSRKSELNAIQETELALSNCREQTKIGFFRTREAVFRRLREPPTLLWVGAVSVAGGYLLARLPQWSFARRPVQQPERTVKTSGVLGQFVLGQVGQYLMRFIGLLHRSGEASAARASDTNIDVDRHMPNP